MKFLIAVVLSLLLLIAAVSGMYYITTKEIILKGVVISHSAIGDASGNITYYTIVRLNGGGILTLQDAESYQVSPGDSLRHVTRIPIYKNF